MMEQNTPNGCEYCEEWGDDGCEYGRVEESCSYRRSILKAKAELYGFEFCHINPTDVDKQALNKLDLNYIRDNHILPVRIEDGILVIATSEPANVFTIDDVKRQTGLDVQILVCNKEDIVAVCFFTDIPCQAVPLCCGRLVCLLAIIV